MNVQPLRRAVPVAFLGAALLLAWPIRSAGYSLLNSSLDADHIGVQVFATSFQAASANNNNTPDANFPSALGCAMSIWKAAAEWNSELRGGTGAGDPHQPNDIGSGASNFDFMYQGTCTQAGGSVSGVVRATQTTLGSGVYAVTSPVTNGWSVRFDDSTTNQWNWQDGPGNETSNPLNKVDIQGIAAHELGHALGLGHSSDPAATMIPFISQEDTYLLRSIAPDDIAGLQAIYGVKSLQKPVITAVSGNLVAGGPITITGSNFSPTGNEVWFSKQTNGNTLVGGPMPPIKVTNIPSTNGGTQIQCTLPAGIYPGDVIVHKAGTSSDQSLKSAPFPFNYPVPSGPALPTLTSITPSSTAILDQPKPKITITGVNLTGATAVQIGTKTYNSTQFSITSDTNIAVPLIPLLNEIGGALPVTVTTPFGTSNALSIGVTLPTKSVIQTSSITAIAGQTVTFYLGAPGVGITPLLAFSGCFGTANLSPYFVSAIGACGDLNFFSPLPAPTDARGITEFQIVVPQGFHGTELFQSFSIDLNAPSFPLPATNVVTVTVQ